MTRAAWLCAAACLWPVMAGAAGALPAPLQAVIARSGLPLSSFGVYVQPVDGEAAPALAALNAQKPFLMASTAKIVTSLAALDLLGADHRSRTRAYATGPISDGRLAGDLVIVGADAGLTAPALARWFTQMHAEGLSQVSGRIVLERVALLHETQPAQVATTAAELSPGTTAEARDFNRGAHTVSVQPSHEARALVSVRPRPPGVLVVNQVSMDSGCNVWARWHFMNAAHDGVPQLWVSGRWDDSCGKRDVAYLRPPPSLPSPLVASPAVRLPAVSTPRLVAALWTQSGGRLAGRVVDTDRPQPRRDAAAPGAWSSVLSTPLAELIREMNKTSNNLAAHKLPLSLASTPLVPVAASRSPLQRAQARMQSWLLAQGLADGDIRIDQGSGQSRAERGKPRALVTLLRHAWHAASVKAFVDSLPVAGVDGTLAHRMRTGAATGQAFLKTGTLHDARALAGYVVAKSGKVYAVAMMVNDAHAARATPTLDAVIEWVAGNG